MKLNFLFLICFLLFLIGCVDRIDERNLTVYNRSTNSIFAIISKDSTMNSLGYYDEFENKKTSYPSFKFHEIKPTEKYISHDRPQHWDTFFKSASEHKLKLYIISKDSVEKYGWDFIFRNKLFIRKFQFSLNELNERDWEIIYR